MTELDSKVLADGKLVSVCKKDPHGLSNRFEVIEQSYNELVELLESQPDLDELQKHLGVRMMPASVTWGLGVSLSIWLEHGANGRSQPAFLYYYYERNRDDKTQSTFVAYKLFLGQLSDGSEHKDIGEGRNLRDSLESS